MASTLLQPPPVVGDVLSIPIDPALRRGYYSNKPMADKVMETEKPAVDPQIAEKPRLGDQNLMQLLKKTLAGAVETTESKEAMPSNLGWRM